MDTYYAYQGVEMLVFGKYYIRTKWMIPYMTDHITHLALSFLIFSSQVIPPQNGAWII